MFYIGIMTNTKQYTVDAQKIKRKLKHITVKNHQITKEHSERKKGNNEL